MMFIDPQTILIHLIGKQAPEDPLVSAHQVLVTDVGCHAQLLHRC